MNTFLGAAQHARPSAIDLAPFATPASSISKAICGIPKRRARRWKRRSPPRAQPGRKVAFTLSDSFCRRPPPRRLPRLIDEGRIDILFANEAETAGADRRAAISMPRSPRSRPRCRPLVVTRSETGRGRGRAAASAPRSRPSRSSGWSTPPARATCSPPASWPAKRAGLASSLASAGRDRRGRGHPALWRAARGRPEGAGRRHLCSPTTRGARNLP